MKTRVILVGSNPALASPDPSKPFAGTRSGKILDLWLESIGVDAATLINVSCSVTPGNRKLKVSEYELERMREELGWFACGNNDRTLTVIALGETASHALKKLDVNHFKLPHPSGRNRKLNDREATEKLLQECREYVEDRDRKCQKHIGYDPGTRPI